MHEMGIVLNMIKTAEQIARDNGAEKIGRLVLQIGELSAVIPQYVRDCFALAKEGTILADSELVIEVIPGNGVCRSCGKVYNILEQDAKCPRCGSRLWDCVSGRELLIKEIGVY